MKRFILSATLIAISAMALAPAALAGQASTPREVSENATLHDLVHHNREVRRKR